MIKVEIHFNYWEVTLKTDAAYAIVFEPEWRGVPGYDELEWIARATTHHTSAELLINIRNRRGSAGYRDFSVAKYKLELLKALYAVVPLCIKSQVRAIAANYALTGNLEDYYSDK